jgi:branched-chain amino acid transport system permease protein
MKHFVHHRHILFALVTVLLLPVMLNSGTLAAEVLIFALAALGCNLLLGYTGLMSFGQGIFFGLGSYAVGLLLLHLKTPLAVALLLSMVLGALVAALVGWMAIRQRGVYFVMLTLAFAQMFYFLAYTFADITGGDNGLLNVPRPDLAIFGVTLIPMATPWQYYVFVAIVFLLIFATLQRIVDSVFGRTLQAIRQNETRAAAVGYDVKRFKLVAFMISGAVTGLAGALNAMLTGIAPLSSIEYHTSESILIITVIGGTGNLFASVLGSAFYILVGDWLSGLWPRWLMLLGFLLIAISLYMQKGIWGLVERIFHRVRSAFPAADPAATKQESNP